MKCSRCGKDITHSFYKIALGRDIFCIICYQKIPYKEKIKMIKK